MIEETDPFALAPMREPSFEAAEIPPFSITSHELDARVARGQRGQSLPAFRDSSNRRRSESVPIFRKPARERIRSLPASQLTGGVEDRRDDADERAISELARLPRAIRSSSICCNAMALEPRLIFIRRVFARGRLAGRPGKLLADFAEQSLRQTIGRENDLTDFAFRAICAKPASPASTA